VSWFGLKDFMKEILSHPSLLSNIRIRIHTGRKSGISINYFMNKTKET